MVKSLMEAYMAEAHQLACIT